MVKHGFFQLDKLTFILPCAKLEILYINVTQETYGEDPYLTGVYAEYYVKGLQGDHPRYIRANAGCKHFDAYAGPENFPVTRLAFDAKVPCSVVRISLFTREKILLDLSIVKPLCR